MLYFFELIQVALGNRISLSECPTVIEWQTLYLEAEKQAMVGIMLSGIEKLPINQRPPQDLLLQWIGVGEMIRRRNALMDVAVVSLFMSLKAENVRIFVFKGQTLAPLYPDSGLRQSGDIDFYCYHEDWDKAMAWLINNWKVDPYELSTQKDVEFVYNDVAYEMHRQLTLFTYPKHERYWKNIVMPEILAHPCSVAINGCNVPTLSPVYNVLFVFVHIFHHLISDGIGLRQFIDWMLLIESLKWDKKKTDILEKHLQGLGLKKAFSGLGAIMTDYLGLSVDNFPLSISDTDHKRAPMLMNNILQMGNFGHNQQYSHSSGVVHGMQHLGRIVKQASLFGHYAPAETWWKIPFMIKWWGKKLWLMTTRK